MQVRIGERHLEFSAHMFSGDEVRRAGAVRVIVTLVVGTVVFGVLGFASPLLGVSPLASGRPSDQSRAGSAVYGLAGDCVRVSTPDGRVLGGVSAPFYAKAAALGQYIFYGRDGRVLVPGNGSAPTTAAGVPERAVWQVRGGDGGEFTLTSAGSSEHRLAVRIRQARGCREFPEPQLNVEGEVFTGAESGELRGFVDSHAHLMATQFLGGQLHCGAPYSPLGPSVALRDCADHSPDGWPAVSEHVLSRPGPHDVVGWPTFRDWPRWDSLTHEQTYYRWIERAWRSGLRMIQNYYVQNRVLCERYPLRDQPCDEMESIRIQHRMLLGLRDYVDAQAGGPGKGFLQITSTAEEARRVIAAGKVAVTLGVEVSEPFGCREIDGRAQCDAAQIDAGLDELDRLGIRQVILTHKFDNALGGTRFDQGTTGAAVNAGELLSTGHPWQTEPCATDQHDNPVRGYPAGACNIRGLSALGAHTIEAMIDRNMVIDIDHLSVKTASAALGIITGRKYPGVVSSHTWTDDGNYRKILATGGVVGLFATPAQARAGDTGRHGDLPADFLSAWQVLRAARSSDYYFGVGFGPDMGGLGQQAYPRPSAASDPVRYPFTAADGHTRIYRQVSGLRVFDVNTDGTAHYGLLPDWIESLRLQAGAQGSAVVADLFRAAEAYARFWERVDAYR